MAEDTKKELTNNEEAFELIELAIDDIELLSRAFELISDVCNEFDTAVPSCEAEVPKMLIN